MGVPLTDPSVSANGTGGLMERFFALLRSLFSSPAPSSSGLSQPAQPQADSEPAEEYVIAPGGYRVRVPRASDLSNTVDEALPEVRQGLNLLPPLPMVVLELLREIQNPASTAASVAEIAASDPTLAASLLRMVNGAAFGLTRKVTSVAEAVSYLGFGVVRSLVVQLRLEQVMPARTPEAALESEDLWVHSLAVSYIADALAERVADVDHGFVSTLGLLHDIGRLAIASQFPERAALLRAAGANPSSGESRLERETRAFGADHCVLGATLALKWKLPADLIQAIRWHHQPQRVFDSNNSIATQKAVYLVQLADQLSKYCFTYAPDMEIDPVAPEAFALLGLPASMPRLLDARVRAAVAKAILLADETTKRQESVVRPFLKLTRGVEAAHLAERLAATPASAAQLKVGAAGLDLLEEDHKPLVFDDGNAPPAEVAATHKLIAPASVAGVKWLLKTTARQWDAQSVSPRRYAPMRTALRAVLSNFVTAEESSAAEIQLASRCNGPLSVAIRCPRLAFSDRLPAVNDPALCRRTLEAELANLINLAWFEIETSEDGQILFLTAR